VVARYQSPSSSASVHSQQGAVDISGVWTASDGAEFTFYQSGERFKWQSGGSVGEGCVDGTSVTFVVGGGALKGKVTEFDSAGRPSAIFLANGVVLRREVSGPR
jgi:hypothetical protein